MTEHAYLAGLRLSGKKVIVVGGGTVAQRRLPLLVANGADVHVISRSATPAVGGELARGCPPPVADTVRD